MSYPMNELLSDLEKSATTTEKWISSSAGAVGTAMHRAGDELSSALDRGRGYYRSAGKRVSREAHAANAVLHRNPYPTVLLGIAAGALVGFLISRSLSNNCR